MSSFQQIDTAACRCPALPEGTSVFWCERHQCRKSAAMQQRCVSNSAAYQAWEAGRGPGQGSAIVSPLERSSLPKTSPPAPAGVFGRIRHFFQALVKHARDWFRKCSRKEIAHRLSICQTCEKFTGTACSQCGCRVNLEKRFLNKLAWRSETCPLGKWPALRN